MFTLSSQTLPNIDVRNIIFITRPNLRLMTSIAAMVRGLEKGQQKPATRKELFLYFLPRRSKLCERQLEIEGVYGSFNQVDEFECDFFPVDNDLLSMEITDTYR